MTGWYNLPRRLAHRALPLLKHAHATEKDSVMSADALEPRLDITPEGNRTVVRFVNCTSLNEFKSDRIGQLLSGLSAEKADCQISLDLDNIEYLTSTVLGHLLVLHKRLAMGGGHLSLENVKPAVREVFRVTQLDQVLDIRATS
jgi:anti-anti-sigma factor